MTMTDREQAAVDGAVVIVSQIFNHKDCKVACGKNGCEYGPWPVETGCLICGSKIAGQGWDNPQICKELVYGRAVLTTPFIQFKVRP
jgi:hypothetical protein